MLSSHPAHASGSVPGPGSLILSPDGRTLLVEKAPIESDIWLLRLAEEGGTEGIRR